MHSMSSVTSWTMVGSKKRPPILCGLPPTSTVAPFSRASATCSLTLATASSSISGPWLLASLAPLPTLSWPTFSVNLATNASYAPSCTSNLLAQTQVCQVLRYFEIIAHSTAASHLASSITLNCESPPCSIDLFLIGGG